MDYLMVMPVKFFRINDGEIACESAFAAHLKQLVEKISEWGDRLIVFSPTMTKDQYDREKGYLSVIDTAADHIDHIAAFPGDRGGIAYTLTAAFLVWPKLWKAVKRASVVHAGPSEDITHAMEIVAIWFSVLLKRHSVFVHDIDQRKTTEMLKQQNKISLKYYIFRKYLHDPLLDLQLKYGAKRCSLVLLKGETLVRDYGNGKPHVKNFYDTAHDAKHVLDAERMRKKLESLEAHAKSIRVVYFGRIVEYKGIMDMLSAVSLVRDKIAGMDDLDEVRFTIIGTGIQKDEIERFVLNERMSETVSLKDPIPYGPRLFEELLEYDFLLAAPLSEDTPRNAFDAMSAGLPILAYDTYYYSDLESTGAVETCRWRSPEDLAELIVRTKLDAPRHREMIKNGIEFARNNTQDLWLRRRQEWKLEFLR